MDSRCNDRRKAQRGAANLFSQLKDLTSADTEMRGFICKNISLLGANITGFEFFPVEKTVYFEVFDEGNVSFLKIIGRVVWIERLPYQEKYRMGIEFSEVADSDKKRINLFLRHTADAMEAQHVGASHVRNI